MPVRWRRRAQEDGSRIKEGHGPTNKPYITRLGLAKCDFEGARKIRVQARAKVN